MEMHIMDVKKKYEKRPYVNEHCSIAGADGAHIAKFATTVAMRDMM